MAVTEQGFIKFFTLAGIPMTSDHIDRMASWMMEYRGFEDRPTLEEMVVEISRHTITQVLKFETEELEDSITKRTW